MPTTRDVIYWLKGSFPIDQVKGNEVKFSCPNCGHSSFYYNVKKQIGFCHRAKCKRVTSYKDLLNIIGTEPGLAGYIPSIDNREEKKILPISLPNGSWDVIGSDLRDQWLVDVLIHRGLTEKDITRFAIVGTAQWVYVPVYEQGKLVQYVGRRLNRNMNPDKGFASEELGRRYDYYKGSRIMDYFFGWSQCKNWSSIVLVENTFNSIWLRDVLRCTTNFGSYLSDEQIKKITQSKIQKVTLLWDEGTNIVAQKTVARLNSMGIEARYLKINGQPDDYTIKELKCLMK